MKTHRGFGGATAEEKEEAVSVLYCLCLRLSLNDMHMVNNVQVEAGSLRLSMDSLGPDGGSADRTSDKDSISDMNDVFF